MIYDIGLREASRLLGNGLIQATSYQLDNQILEKKVDGIVEFGYTYDLKKMKPWMARVSLIVKR